jgi:hypothetical protein
MNLKRHQIVINYNSIMKLHYQLSLVIMTILSVTGCNKKETKQISAAETLHNNQDKLTQVIIYDVFTPPVASRLYVYASLASFEAIRFEKPGVPSITAKLKGFDAMPLPEIGKTYNFTLAASRAFFTVARNVKVFSVDSLTHYEQSVYKRIKDTLDDAAYNRSIAFGDSVANVILRRANMDGYLQTRGKAKYLGSNDPGHWRPTPPDYLDGVEWCWNTMEPMIMDSASQFKPSPPPRFTMDTSSVYYKGLREVYTINKNLTKEEKDIARYWDDNPFVTEHTGHMMFGNKKITPGGHWMGICAIASRMTNADEVKTAEAYAYTAIALYDAFISSWDEKYRSSYIRPVTAINESFDPTWMPYLQTPSFPEYTSAHSTISACAATLLSSLFGQNFAFQDTADLRYIGMQRHFNSFEDAAAEVSVSRIYGGIHYRFTADTSMAKGRELGEFILRRLK